MSLPDDIERALQSPFPTFERPASPTSFQPAPPKGSPRDMTNYSNSSARARYDMTDDSIPDPYVRTRIRPTTRAYHPDSPLSSPTFPPISSKHLPPYITRPSFSDSPLLWLSLYFLLNLSLTLYNKTLLLRFPFPYSLTALHAFCGTVGTFWMIFYQQSGARKRRTGKIKRIWNVSWNWEALTGIPKLDGREIVILLLFSVLYTINIAVSNISLKLVTVPFHQVVRASSPFFTILCSFILLGTRSTSAKLISLVPVVAGVGFATYGDYYFTVSGFILTVLGTILAALKTVITSLLQSSPFQKPSTFPKLRLTSLHLLALVSPLAFVQSLVLAHMSGELQRAREQITSLTIMHANSRRPVLLLLMNGTTAFLLNIVSFSANKRVGPLGMSVAANVKQVLTILCAVAMFNLTITPMNALGIVLTLFGGIWYARVEMRERRRKGEEEVK